MPFTPFHLGPALALGALLRRRLHLPTLLLASVLVDVEPLLVLLLDLAYPLHGYLHTFLGSLALGLLVGYTMYILERKLAPRLRPPSLERGCAGKRSFLIAGVAGTWLHVLLDSPLYSDIKPFYPAAANPLYNPSLAPYIYGLCLVSGAAGLALYFALLACRFSTS